ncbi:Lsr2 family protein [Streptomyces chrestomyceticus]|uniref:histone-like nucleoid-structuring protein Lsr2 n=1 Tax=Streptomyces chrestomyceticus TaxID=68185 RepID=UPI0033C511E0
MAQRIITIYTDDLTGEESRDATPHTIAVDGIAYEFDLTPDSYDQLMEAVGPFLKAGRRVGRIKSGAGARKAQSGGGDTAKIRAWAKSKGYEINDRGRVPANIRKAYVDAN